MQSAQTYRCILWCDDKGLALSSSIDLKSTIKFQNWIATAIVTRPQNL